VYAAPDCCGVRSFDYTTISGKALFTIALPPNLRELHVWCATAGSARRFAQLSHLYAPAGSVWTVNPGCRWRISSALIARQVCARHSGPLLSLQAERLLRCLDMFNRLSAHLSSFDGHAACRFASSLRELRCSSLGMEPADAPGQNSQLTALHLDGRNRLLLTAR
jgi:hypothetical protein